MKSQLLLLHGALGSKNVFGAISVELSHHFDLRVFNFNNHGNTPKRPEHFNIRGFGEDALAYLDRHNIEKADIFGFSMGGYVALWLALNFPKRVNKIMTLGTKMNWTEAAANHEAALLNPAKMKEKAPRLVKRLIYLHGEDHWEKLLFDSAALLQELGVEPALSHADFESIKHTVRICVGDQDYFVNIDESQEVFEMMENASLSVMPDTPHQFRKVNQKDLIFEIRRFFKRSK